MIKFSKVETDVLTRRIQEYFSAELDQEIGQFPAQFLLEFFVKEIGPHIYNRGLLDAQAVLEARIESIGEAIYELEKSTDLSR